MLTPLGGEENFFRSMRHRFDLDGLDVSTTVPDDPDRTVAKPRQTPRQRDIKSLTAAIEAAQACHARHTAAGVPAHAFDAHRG